LGKKVSGHFRVIVLTCMHKTIAKQAAGRASGIERPDDRGNLHEIRACPGDEIDGRHEFMRVSGSLNRQRESAQGFCDLDGDAAYFHQLVKWDWGGTLLRDRTDERLDARILTFVLPP